MILPLPPHAGLFLLTTLLAAAVPGLNVFLVLSLGVRAGGRSASRWAALGVTSANLLYLALSAAGLSALLLGSAGLLSLVRWLGAGYLAYAGVRLLLTRGARPNAAADPADDDPPRAPLRAEDGWHSFLRGFGTHLSNPKAVLYWSALLPHFVDPARPVIPQLAFLGIGASGCELLVLLAYGTLAAAAAGTFSRRPDGVVWLNRVAGVGFLLVGGWLALAGVR